MKIDVNLQMNLRTGAVLGQVQKAAEDSLKNVVMDITRDTKDFSPFLTGTNRRSIDYEVRGLSGSVFSTSGYGGYLETGTLKMPARPYFRPALDRNKDKLPAGIKARL